MTDFRYWQGEATKVGLVMCVLCFEMKNRALMYKDESGDTWDVCQECHDLESGGYCACDGYDYYVGACPIHDEQEEEK